MNTIQTLALVLFVVGYVAITFEHQLRTHKAPTALLLGIVLWLLVTLNGMGDEPLAHQLEVAAAEIFGIVVFLLAAMTLVKEGGAAHCQVNTLALPNGVIFDWLDAVFA